MPICIECREPVTTLWTQYAAAGDSSVGHNIRLTVCQKCGQFCDKYVEHDFVVMFIDLVLIKPQVYRHLLYNALMHEEDRFDVCTFYRPPPIVTSRQAKTCSPSIRRLAVLLLLFDVYLTWARIEKQASPSGDQDNLGKLAKQPIVFQYLFFLVMCTCSALAFHQSIRFLTSSHVSPFGIMGFLPRYPKPNSVSTALLVSSSTKLFPILMVIWEYDVPAAARSLGWAVVANNVEALKILLGCSYGVAAMLATAGAISRWVVGQAVLWVAGLDGLDPISESHHASQGDLGWASITYVGTWVGKLAMG